MRENLAKTEVFPNSNDPRFEKIVPKGANDSQFGPDSEIDYLVSNTPKDTIKPFPIIDTDDIEFIIADDEFAKTPLTKRLTRADFEPEAILGARLEAQAATEIPYPYTETVVTDKVFADNRPLTREDFTEKAIRKAREGATLKESSPSHGYTAFHIKGQEKSIGRQRQAPEKTDDFSDTEGEIRYTATIHGSTLITTPDEYKRTGNLINPNAERLSRKDFPKGTPLPLPVPRESVVLEKPSLFKRFVPNFLRRFFNR